jgi:hypothetical protein
MGRIQEERSVHPQAMTFPNHRSVPNPTTKSGIKIGLISLCIWTETIPLVPVQEMNTNARIRGIGQETV